MRAFHLITRLDPGGAEHQLLELCRGLALRGVEVAVGYLKGPGELTGKFRAAGCKVVRTALDPILTTHPIRALRSLTNLLRRARPDVVHTHLPKAEILGNAAARAAGVKRVVSTKHNDEPHWLRFPYRLLHRAAASLADCVIVPSRHVAEFTRRVGCRAPVRVAPYGIDADAVVARADPGKTMEFRSRFAGGAKFVVGCIARLEPQKGLFDFAEAARRVGRSDVAFVVVGDGSLRSQLERESSVKFFAKTSDVPSALRALDLLVLPSHWEGFGLVLLEAMACAVPIAASDVSSIPEVLGGGVAGALFPPRNPEAMATVISDLLTDKSRARSLVQAAQHRVRSEFAITRTVESIVDVYRGF